MSFVIIIPFNPWFFRAVTAWNRVLMLAPSLIDPVRVLLASFRPSCVTSGKEIHDGKCDVSKNY